MMKNFKFITIIFIFSFSILGIIACANNVTVKKKMLYISAVNPSSGIGGYGKITLSSNYETSTDLTGYELRTVTKLEVTNDVYYLQKWAFFPSDSSIDANGTYIIDGSNDLAIVVYELASSGVAIYLKDTSSEIIDTYTY